MVLLPSRLHLGTLPNLLSAWPAEGGIEIDFSGQSWVLPSGTAALSCLVLSALRQHRQVRFITDAGRNVGYWERMAFFRNFGVEPGVCGRAHPARDRFSEVRHIVDADEVDGIAEQLVRVTLPTPELEQIQMHIVTEALNNVCQHSGASGYCASQAYPREGNAIRFCIADPGVGLKGSLGRFGLENDEAAIEKALEVGVTGRSPAAIQAMPRHMRNRGVGLSAIQRLVVGNGGSFALWSGSAFYVEGPTGSSVRQYPSWHGTLIAARVPRQISASFRDVMRQLTTELYQVERQRGRNATA